MEMGGNFSQNLEFGGGPQLGDREYEIWRGTRFSLVFHNDVAG